MSETISFSWSCSVTDRQRVDGLLCQSMQCDRCKEFRINRDQAIIDMHLKEMEGREPQGLEKTAPETYFKLKSQIQALQEENEILKDCVKWYSNKNRYDPFGSVEIFSDNGERARQALKETKEGGE